MEYLIDTAKIEDLDALVAFQLDLAKDYKNTDLDEDTLRKGIMGGLLKRDNMRYLVARDSQGVPVGSMVITSEWSVWHNHKYYWIQSAYTRKDMRRKGVFSALFEEVKHIAENAGASTDSIRLYVDRNSLCSKIVCEKIGMKESNLNIYQLE